MSFADNVNNNNNNNNNTDPQYCDTIRIESGRFEHDSLMLGEMPTSITVRTKESIRWCDYVIDPWTQSSINEKNKLTDVYVNIHDISGKLNVSINSVQALVKTNQVAQELFNNVLTDNLGYITLSSSSSYVKDVQNPIFAAPAPNLVTPQGCVSLQLSRSPPPFAQQFRIKPFPASPKPRSAPVGVGKPLEKQRKFTKKVEHLKQMWSHEANNTEKLRKLCQFIEDNKADWHLQLSQTHATMIKTVTPFSKENGWVYGRSTNLKNYSVYIVKGKKSGTFKTFINLGKTHKLGQGSFKQAFEALNFDTLKKKALTKVAYKSPAGRELGRGEAKAMCMFPNNKSLLQTTYVGEIGYKQYMFMPLCELGELKKYESKYGPLAEKDMNQITLDVLEGMQIMHEKNVVHQDIKPTNIFLYRDKFNGKIRAKVADLGLAKSLNDDLNMMGSPFYYSPEKFMNRIPSLDSTLGKGVDVFSLGLTLYEMYFGVADPKNSGERLHPFEDLYRQYFGSNKQLLAKEIERRYDDKFTYPDNPLKAAIWGMLNPDPEMRITITTALEGLKKAWLVSSL